MFLKNTNYYIFFKSTWN